MSSVCIPTGISTGAGVKVPLHGFPECFVQLRHWLELVHQDSPQLIVELAVNLFLSSKAAQGKIAEERPGLENEGHTVSSFFSCTLQSFRFILVLVALPKAGFDPLQPRLALLRRPVETLTGHPAGNDREEVSCSVCDSQLLLYGIFSPHLDEGQGLCVSPWRTSGT